MKRNIKTRLLNEIKNDYEIYTDFLESKRKVTPYDYKKLNLRILNWLNETVKTR